MFEVDVALVIGEEGVEIDRVFSHVEERSEEDEELI